jgi:hypothetical protein
MSTDDRIRNNPTFRKPMMLFGIVMTCFYFTLGLLLLLRRSFLPNVPDEYRLVFSAMLLIYGGYRGWRVYADLKRA